MSNEENIELSPVEAMSVLGWKKSKIYYWISSGKFKTVQRINGDKIIISPADIERLRNKADSVEKISDSEISENVQNNSVQNITKNYENVQKNLTSETFEFFNKSLDAIKQMHIASIQNYNYSLKLLTDGQSSIEKENLELKQEKKAVEESLKQSKKEFEESLKNSEFEFQKKLEQFEKVSKEKNIIISILVFIMLLASFIFFLVQNKFILL